MFARLKNAVTFVSQNDTEVLALRAENLALQGVSGHSI